VIENQGPGEAVPTEAKMSLLDHLTELRARLWKAIVAIAIFGGFSLAYARDLFEILMRPVLAALPEDGRSLVYTSGIEEINVLLKVGLYAGLFLAMPVILFQLWQFVAPGLYVHERRLVAPFVTIGTTFFVGGAVFCYFAVLPTMFKFLLTEGDEHEVRNRAAVARGADADAARLLLLGDAEGAKKQVAQARAALLAAGEGKVVEPDARPSLEELRTREALLSARLDSAVALGQRTDSLRPLARRSAQAHTEAQASFATGDRVGTAKAQDATATAIASVYDASLGAGAGAAMLDLWRLDKHLGAATRRVAEQEWTRPMLTMREQLSLVLLLEVAFGIIFELPLIMSLLSWMGIVKASFLAKYQRHAILVCVIVAAIVTPSGDAVNLALMAVPMIVCYELGVLAAWIIGKRRDARIRAPQLSVVQGGSGGPGSPPAAP
jgi:sec-independent protein translocase protein TatC